jgi:L-aspartate oxidase
MAKQPDVLVIGSGLAGLALALKVAPFARVTIISKGTLPATNTAIAQGGIAAVHDERDSFAQHIADTLEAGAGLCHRPIVEEMVRQAPLRIQDLLHWGVRFDRLTGDQEFDLTREGGHHGRRIFHFADQTGAEIHAQLLQQAMAEPNIEILANHLAVELITNHKLDPLKVGAPRCLGAFVMNTQTGRVRSWLARATVLATGGAGKVYLYTSNWPGATGDGIALAYRAGARVANLEFMQFHPTCLYHPQARNFLISEALRGEGGVLKDRHGVPFMEKYHPLASLAPRDIVARSIDTEMKRSGDSCVYLDMTHLTPDFLIKRFPAIHAKCLEHGIDMTKEPIPVVPAAHYLCGGVLTDIGGQTDVEALFAIGETACTGFHGANRLASNSLLECIVMAHECSLQLEKRLPQWERHATRLLWEKRDKPGADELVVIAHTWDEIRRLMWNYVGIVRSNRRLRRAHRRLNTILQEVQEYEADFKAHPDIIELRNLAWVAALTVQCALQRQESRGIHHSLDYPIASLEARDTIIGAEPTLSVN